ncbi:MAG TPA: hypothetical protein ENH72_02435 [Pseudomonas sabulinigri]|jgi:hypothetical protein|uniref:Uncharacterized protein n=1 Tax=marine sediment metagenome TaxID=412755 RepID=A0A0F9VIG6_9ZZZZ|nr:hypothetical protein [Halopseudomonas sabulinigri]HEC52734.1 hypothetical protein [Halopseudomonas sabulinigri]|tara:strand:- start:2121 stop:2336 length:216 start_codon:yes stop_codon:yes gene_type:complete
MAFDPDYLSDNSSSTSSNDLRRERRRQEDKRRMSYRRAIEDYRESQSLQATFCDFPELLGQTDHHRSQPRY